MVPVVEPSTKLQDLKDTGHAIFESINRADPNGTWVSQGWLFINDPQFWGTPEVDAYLSGVPDNRMILLDLAGDIKEIWRLQPAFRKKPYIWNLLHNFGGRTRLQGDLPMVA